MWRSLSMVIWPLWSSLLRLLLDVGEPYVFQGAIYSKKAFGDSLSAFYQFPWFHFIRTLDVYPDFIIISVCHEASPLILPVSLSKCSFHALSWLDFGHHLELINLYEIIDLNRSMQDIYSYVDFFRVCGVKSVRNDFNTCIAEDLTNKKLNTTSELWGFNSLQNYSFWPSYG